ncbi:MAG: hypothetical protein WCW44_02205 [archaeon]|jgi:hypothetical protein
MAGGKIHGQGGHGRFSKELQRKYAHSEEALAKIARAKEKSVRWFERKSMALKEHIETNLNKTAVGAIKNIEASTSSKTRTPISRNNALVRLIAVDQWFFEHATKKAKELGIEREVEPEALHLLKREERENYWGELVGKHVYFGFTFHGRTSKELKEEIEKWKIRVPRIAQGQYTR